MDGFDGLSSSEIEFVPTCVLQLNHGRLLDASAEFRSHFDEVIENVRATLDVSAARDFRTSDGRLQATGTPSAQELTRLHRLRVVKIQVLEIVWAYLYSGREREAWQSLQDMWPAGDASRIRAELLKARSSGIHAQLDGVSVSTRHKKVRVFDLPEVAPAQAILMRMYPPDSQAMNGERRETEVELVIDAAGKVQSVKPVGKTDELKQYVQLSTAQWRFIPAFRAGKPVASRTRTVVSLMQ